MQATIQQSSSLQEVIYGVFQKSQASSTNQGLAIALVAAHPMAGTTYLTHLLTEALNSDASACATSLDCRELAQHGPSHREEVPSSTILPSRDRGTWRNSRDFRSGYLMKLKARYSSVLIDCPSLKESKDILGLAPVVDGVLLVVEANKTTKSQIAFLERTIESVGGKSLGHILNKRTYPIPDWAYKALGF